MVSNYVRNIVIISLMIFGNLSFNFCEGSILKVRWVSRQFSRFDLALTKLSRPLGIVNTISNLSVALIMGFFIFGVIFTVGFIVILFLGYVLHRVGFFMETVTETFDQQGKVLYQRTVRFSSAYFAKCMKMNEEELEQELEEAGRDLRL